MSKRKVIEWSSLVVTLIIFVIATFVFLNNKNHVQKYVVDYSCYDDLSKIDFFEEQIEKHLNISFEYIYLKNSGEIIIDEDGKIEGLFIDCYYTQNEKTYGLSIEKNDNDYCLIREEIYNIDIEKNSLSRYLDMLAFSKYLIPNEQVRYVFTNEYSNRINVNANTQKYLFDGQSFTEIKSSIDGLFIKAKILFCDNSFDELYFQVK